MARKAPTATWKQKESRVVGGVVSNVAEGIGPDRPIDRSSVNLPKPPIFRRASPSALR